MNDITILLQFCSLYETGYSCFSGPCKRIEFIYKRKLCIVGYAPLPALRNTIYYAIQMSECINFLLQM